MSDFAERPQRDDRRTATAEQSSRTDVVRANTGTDNMGAASLAGPRLPRFAESIRAVRAAPRTDSSAPIRRLTTAHSLVRAAGAPKPDQVLGVGKFAVKRTMSASYKSILSALDAFHAADFGVVAEEQNVRHAGAERIQLALRDVYGACEAYSAKHKKPGPRTGAIRSLMTELNTEFDAVTKISADPWIYASLPWAEAVKRMTGSLFHGTSSALLDVMGSELLTGAELERRGAVRSTGEGDFFSRQRNDAEASGEKDFISVGEGLPGLGTAYAYALAAANDKNYNTANYDDALLAHEIKMLRELIANWDEALNQVPADDIMGARRNRGQFEGLLRKLDAERVLRDGLPADHPRRSGAKYADSTYPLVFEFAPDGLDVRNPRPDLSARMDADSPRQLGGERSVRNPSVELGDPARLIAVYCPEQYAKSVFFRVGGIVGHYEFKLITFESMGRGPDAMRYTHVATVEMMDTLYDKMRQMVIASYHGGMTTGAAVDKERLKNTAHQIGL